MRIREIRNPRSEGKVKKLFCNIEISENGSARLVTKGRNVNSSIDLQDFLRQIPREYIEMVK